MSSLAAQMPLIVVTVLGEQRLGDVERLVREKFGGLLVEELDDRVLGERRPRDRRSGPWRRGVEDALQRDDAALPAHGLGHRVADLLAGLLAVVGDVAEIHVS